MCSSDLIRAYAQARQSVALDLVLEPQLREELLDRLDTLGVNPLDDRIAGRARLARRQYDALLRYADDPNGLSRKLTAAKEAGRGTVHAVQ